MGIRTKVAASARFSLTSGVRPCVRRLVWSECRGSIRREATAPLGMAKGQTGGEVRRDQDDFKECKHLPPHMKIIEALNLLECARTPNNYMDNIES